MHWQLKTRARVLATGLLLALSSTARAESHRTEEGTSGSAETTTTTTMTAVPAETPTPVTTTTTTTTVVTPAVPGDWSVFGGRVEKGSHTAFLELIDSYYQTMGSYRFGLTNGIGVGIALQYGSLFNTYGAPSISSTSGFNINPFVTASVLQRPRWDIGVTAAPGLRWFFRQCANGGYCYAEQRAIDLIVRLTALYAIVPHVLMFGAGLDLYPEMQIKQNGSGVSFTFPMLAGGVVEYHFTPNFALTAEAKLGFAASSSSAYNQTEVFYITRFALGLAFHGVP